MYTINLNGFIGEVNIREYLLVRLTNTFQKAGSNLARHLFLLNQVFREADVLELTPEDVDYLKNVCLVEGVF